MNAYANKLKNEFYAIHYYLHMLKFNRFVHFKDFFMNCDTNMCAPLVLNHSSCEWQILQLLFKQKSIVMLNLNACVNDCNFPGLHPQLPAKSNYV